MPLGTEVGLGPGHFVLDGDPTPREKGTAPSLFPHVYCGQTAGWIKMPIGTEVELGPGHIAFDGDRTPATRKDHSSPPLFGPCLLWLNGHLYQLLLTTCEFMELSNDQD